MPNRKTKMIKAIKIKRWQPSLGTILVPGLSGLTVLGFVVITAVEKITLIGLVFGAIALGLIFLSVRTAYMRQIHSRQVTKIMKLGNPRQARILSARTKRMFDIDLSLSSLIDGSSGIQLPQCVIFQVGLPSGEQYESDPILIPATIAERHVAQQTPVSVYMLNTETYVNIEELPPYDFFDALKSPLSSP